MKMGSRLSQSSQYFISAKRRLQTNNSCLESEHKHLPLQSRVNTMPGYLRNDTPQSYQAHFARLREEVHNGVQERPLKRRCAEPAPSDPPRSVLGYSMVSS